MPKIPLTKIIPHKIMCDERHKERVIVHQNINFEILSDFT